MRGRSLLLLMVVCSLALMPVTAAAQVTGETASSAGRRVRAGSEALVETAGVRLGVLYAPKDGVIRLGVGGMPAVEPLRVVTVTWSSGIAAPLYLLFPDQGFAQVHLRGIAEESGPGCTITPHSVICRVSVPGVYVLTEGSGSGPPEPFDAGDIEKRLLAAGDSVRDWPRLGMAVTAVLIGTAAAWLILMRCVVTART